MMGEMVAVSVGGRQGELPADKARRINEWLDAGERAKAPHPFTVGTFHCFCATCGEQRIAAAIREQAASAEQPEPQPEWVRIENEARIRDGRTLHPGPIPRSAYRNNPYADD